jgi:hypothetical protein
MIRLKHWIALLAGLSLAPACSGAQDTETDYSTPDPAEDADMSPIGGGTIMTLPDGTPAMEGITQAEFDAYELVGQYPEVFPESLPAPVSAVHDILAAWESGLSVEDAHKAILSDAVASALPEGDIGISRQAWHSAVYHGDSTLGGACYADTTALNNTYDCWFPRYKSFKMTGVQHNPSRTLNCSNQALISWPSVSHPTRAQHDQIMGGFISGSLDNRNTFPGAVIDSVGTADGLFLTNTIDCSPVNALAFTTIYHPQGQASQSGLAGTPRSAKQYSHVDTTVNPMYIFQTVVDVCHETPTADMLNRYSRYIGVHELLHAMGFNHFTSGVMRAGQGCGTSYRATENSINASIALVPQAFRDAIGIYSGGHESDDGVLHDTGLTLFGPLNSDAQDTSEPNISGD